MSLRLSKKRKSIFISSSGKHTAGIVGKSQKCARIPSIHLSPEERWKVPGLLLICSGRRSRLWPLLGHNMAG